MFQKWFLFSLPQILPFLSLATSVNNIYIMLRTARDTLEEGVQDRAVSAFVPFFLYYIYISLFYFLYYIQICFLFLYFTFGFILAVSPPFGPYLLRIFQKTRKTTKTISSGPFPSICHIYVCPSLHNPHLSPIYTSIPTEAPYFQHPYRTPINTSIPT